MTDGLKSRAGKLRATGLCGLALLVAAPAAVGAAPGRYAGKTSQGLTVAVKVTKPSRANLSIGFRGRCSNGRGFQARSRTRDVSLTPRGYFSTALAVKGELRGIGRGTHRFRIDGQVRKNVAEGRFRSTFTSGSVTCRSPRVTFTIRREAAG
jgi:hypothetical protein